MRLQKCMQILSEGLVRLVAVKSFEARTPAHDRAGPFANQRESGVERIALKEFNWSCIVHRSRDRLAVSPRSYWPGEGLRVALLAGLRFHGLLDATDQVAFGNGLHQRSDHAGTAHPVVAGCDPER